jgi:Bacterial Ig-like domain
MRKPRTIQEQTPTPSSSPGDFPEVSSPDFQFALEKLTAAYQPVLEDELNQLKSSPALGATAAAPSRIGEEETQFAKRIFESFMTEEVAARLLPQVGRESLGPVENWRWCLEHVRCSLIFGWLACRGPRTFQSLSYYLYEYWKCIREVSGKPVGKPPTAAEQADFQVVVGAFAAAYKPYLTDQLATVEFPSAISGDVISGEYNAATGQDELCQIFDRMLSTETTRALFGGAAYDQYNASAFYGFCRCWATCAMCLGCCLARVRNVEEIRLCLIYYVRCLEACLRPLTCELTAPTGCVTETEFASAGIFRGVEIEGTAAGSACSHYILQWRQNGIGAWQTSSVVYPGGATQGACGVTGGLLGYLSTFPFVSPGLVEIQLCVYSSEPNVAPCCTTIEFELYRNLVWIEGIEGIDAALPPGVFDPTAPLVDSTGVVRSFGTVLRIYGAAAVGGCTGQTIKSYTLSYQQGFTTTTAGAWSQFWQVNYNTPLQVLEGASDPLLPNTVLTNLWSEVVMPIVLPFQILCDVISDDLSEAYWDTQNPQAGLAVQFPPPPPLYPAPCVPPPASSTWNSTPLFPTNCQSGRYTLRLTVTDTAGNTTDNLRQVWFDNKQIYASIANLAIPASNKVIAACSTVDLSFFAALAGGGSPDCTVPWPAQILGVAYDQYIEEGNFTHPSDNFYGYSLQILKNGGGWHQLTIPGPDSVPVPLPPTPPWSGPYLGTTRVGDPGTRCSNAVPPPGPIPPQTDGILALFDMRRLDSVCNTNPADADLVLQRATISASTGQTTPGECCGFILYLSVSDTSICPKNSTDNHTAEYEFPFCICNDLPPVAAP